jgi:hypothetical protein
VLKRVTSFLFGSDPGQRRALLFASFVCLLFISVVISVQRPIAGERTHSLDNTWSPAPSLPVPTPLPEEPQVKDMNERFRLVPDDFKHVDFRNRSYGSYKFSRNQISNLTLKDGEGDIYKDDHRGWFSLKDVYYRDVTGDGRKEAIVMLWHVECGGSCDGGAALFYVYTMREGKLKKVWQYETGSNAYGCGLKSLTVQGTWLLFELFGHCPVTAIDDPGPTKFMIDDLTYVLFEFNGKRFVRHSTEFVSTPSSDVKNHEPQIRIY